MPKSVTVRNGAGSRRHNIRDYKEMPEHIDKDRIKDNVVLVDKPLWQAYNEIFEKAIEDYNAKQTRADRKYEGGAQAYLNEIKREKGDMARKPFYETFVQIGDRNDTGIDSQNEREALLDYMKGFQERNPNLRVIGAYLHADETDGTLHGHIDWVPVATTYKRGFALQNGLKRALAEQGFEGTCKKFNAYLGWQESERQALRDICRQHGIEPAQSKGEGREWLDKETYIAKKQYEEALQKAQKATERADKAEARANDLEEKLKAYEKPEADLRDVEELLERGKKTFTGKTSYNKKDTEKIAAALKHGATADYRERSLEERLASSENYAHRLEGQVNYLEGRVKHYKGEVDRLNNQVFDLIAEGRLLKAFIQSIANLKEKFEIWKQEEIARQELEYKKQLEAEAKAKVRTLKRSR